LIQFNEWKAKLPTGSEGLLAMFEINGKQYVAVNARTPIRFGIKKEKQKTENPESARRLCRILIT
jgi:quinoprotein glucose dehydrogenase